MSMKNQCAQITCRFQKIQLAIDAENIQRVTVADIDMRFGSMVWFMVKWAFAAIPAFIIIFVILLVAFAFLSAFVGGFSSLFSH
jgi:hypothetical protein